MTQTTRQQQLTNDTRRLTQAIVRRYVRLLGGSCSRTGFGAELRVRLAGGEYFTDCLQDAIGTARYMARFDRKLAARVQEAEADLIVALGQDVLLPETDLIGGAH
jgi:hypothetical protein